MKKFMIGLVACIFVLLIICLWTVKPAGNSTAMMNMPDWVQGTLLLTTKGIPNSDASASPEHYVCAFDFSEDTVNTVKIPSEAVMLQDAVTQDPQIVYPAYNSYCYYGHHDEYNSFDPMKWRNYAREKIVYGGQNDLPQLEIVSEYPDIDEIYAPLTILGTGNSDSYDDVYFLEYTVSGQGDLAIGISRIRDYVKGETTKLTYGTLPLDADLSLFFWAISQDGKIAWTFDGCIYISDGTDIRIVEDDGVCTYGMCWLDTDTLLYMASATKAALPIGWPENYSARVWHFDSNAWEELIPLDAETYELRTQPLKVAYNDNSRCVAMYYPYTYAEEVVKSDFIMFYNLETGEHYKFVPWEKDDSDVEENAFLFYGISDDGVRHSPSNDKREPMMMWYP